MVSLAVIGLELVFMRGLSIRFWSHLAGMVIGVALLGFAASGTALTLLRRKVFEHPQAWMSGLALAFSLSVPLAWWASGRVPLDIGFLAWNLLQVTNVLTIELLMLVPFLLAGAAIGVAMMDRPEHVSGHYAANLAGSGLGAVAAVALMLVFSTQALVHVMAWVACMAGLILLPWRRPAALVGAVLLSAALLGAGALTKSPVPMSPYKMLAQARTWPDTEAVEHAEGPLGQIDVIAGKAIHYAPGLSLQYTDPLPAHVLLLVDGEPAGAVYDCRRGEDWAFLDFTTAAAGYHLLTRPAVCIVGGGGGEQIGLALFHRSPQVTALEMNPQIIRLMTDRLASRGGSIYQAPGVQVLNQEGRSYFSAGTRRAFDLIQMPPLDAFGASGAGLYASQESYLYTVEAIGSMLDQLRPGGVLSITRWARTPPRDELRTLDIAIQAIGRQGKNPTEHLAMIRSWATVTVLAFREPISLAQVDALRVFCRGRSFDICYLPGLKREDTNQYHVLDQPYYFDAAKALLGPDRRRFLADYLFDVEATTDDKPYFFHSFRWGSMRALSEQFHGSTRAFLEFGYLMAVAALAQTVAIGVLLILIPLAPGVKALRHLRGRASSLGYFLSLGIGFMFLEMGFLQKLILYLGHPIYSAALVISGFLVFAGLGSLLSGRWRRPKRVIPLAAACVAALALVYLLGLDAWLRSTQALPMAARFLIAGATVAPLALAMGHMFPAGLRLLGGTSAGLVPWVWAVNGLASVAATVGAPLLAMTMGFSCLTLVAAGCYALAGALGRALPGRAA